MGLAGPADSTSSSFVSVSDLSFVFLFVSCFFFFLPFFPFIFIPFPLDFSTGEDILPGASRGLSYR